MNSCLFECRVMHARLSPRRHRFEYRLFLFGLDLDELDLLHHSLRLFSRNRANLYSFRDRDFLPIQEARHRPTDIAALPPPIERLSPGLKLRVIAHLASQGIELRDGRVLLVTLPRVLGYLFNPVSFYFCYDRAGRPVAALAEVTNTFREMKPYVLGPDTLAGTTFARRTPKHFYVSPFSDVDVAFAFSLQAPDDQLAIQIDDYAGDERTLTSTLRGPRRELTDGRLAWYTIKYPLLTLRIIGLIHWHALRLWWKRLPWFAKAARPADQRDLYRPHSSLAPAPADGPLPAGPLPFTKA